MQYWAISASSLSVLIFLCITIWCAPENKPPPSLPSFWHAILSLSCIVLHTAVCCVTLGTSSLTSKFSALLLNWVTNVWKSLLLLIKSIGCSLPECHFLFFRLWGCIEVIVDALSWIGSCKVNSTCFQNFSILCFCWYVPCHFCFHLILLLCNWIFLIAWTTSKEEFNC